MRLPALFVASTICWAAEVSGPPPAIRAEGVPPVEQSLAEDLARYGEFRTALALDWHPQRREMLISTRFADVAQIHRVRMPGGARMQLTFGSERVAGGEYEPVNGRLFSYIRDVGGSEFYQLFVFDGETGRSTMLSDGKSRNSSGRWSPDGKRIAHTSTRRNKKDTDVWVVEPASAASAKLVFEADSGGWDVEDWSPDGSRLLLGRYTSVDTSALYEVEIATGTKRALTPERKGVSWSAASYSPDGKTIYAVSAGDGADFDRLVTLNLRSGSVGQLRPDLKWDAQSPVLSHDGTLLAWTVNENGSERLHVMDPASRKEKTMPDLPLGIMGGLNWRRGSHELAFSLASAKSPSDVYSVDADSGKLERWTTSETGGLNADKFAEPEVISWKSFDGLSIPGFYYKPPSRFTGPRPVMISIHGGPEGQAQAGYLGRSNYFLEELGIAQIYPNVRGSSGYGQKYLSLDNGVKREDSVKDIGALLDWIATRPELDAKRVMVMGGSYGGYMTLASMTHYNDRFRCAVDVVGISNWVTFLENTESYRRDLRRAEYGDERDPKMRDFLFTISPVKSVDKITKPMMIVQGRNDPRVPWTESEQMVGAIRQRNTPVWYLLAADEGHGFSKKKNVDYQFAATVLFIQKHLLDQVN